MNVLLLSGSVEESVPTTALTPAFSAMEVADRAMSVGASLTFVIAPVLLVVIDSRKPVTSYIDTRALTSLPMSAWPRV